MTWAAAACHRSPFRLRPVALLLVTILPVVASAQPRPFGSVVNSAEHEEYAPFFVRGTAGVDTLIYTSSRKPPAGAERVRQSSLMYAMRPSSEYGTKPITEGWSDGGYYAVGNGATGDRAFTEVTNGVVAMSAERIIFAADRRLENGGIDTRLDLYEIRRTGDRAGAVRAIDEVNAPDAWDSQPSLSPDGKTLFFVSNREGGSGSNDIWYATLGADGEWSRARPLGAVNTAGSEFSPFVAPDGRLYFSSDWDYATGARGTRKHDICRADLAWRGGVPTASNPSRLDIVLQREGCLGPADAAAMAVNSDDDDEFPFVTADRTTLFYSSSRGTGRPDIYAAQLPGACVRLCVTVTEQLQDSLGRALSEPYASGVGVSVVDVESGQPAVADGPRCYLLRAGRTYRAMPSAIGSRECFDLRALGDSIQTVVVRRDAATDTIHRAFTIIRRRIAVPDVVFSSAEAIPFFITGYWWPNTTANLRDYRESNRKGLFKETGFINAEDYPYEQTARSIDSLFEARLYRRLDEVLPRFTASCADTLALVLSIHGYTDPRRLTPPHIYPGKTVTVGVDMTGDSVVIREGSLMTRGRWLADSSDPASRTIELKENGQLGNILLSKLRAHYTFETIDRVMRARSPVYRELAESGRVRVAAEGYGRYRDGDIITGDDPQSRRIEIYIDAVPVPEIAEFRREKGGRPVGRVRQSHRALTPIAVTDTVRSNADSARVPVKNPIRDAKPIAGVKIDPHFEGLRPLLGRTWRGAFAGPDSGRKTVDVARWEPALGGKAVRVRHSINDGVYGGETIITWDEAEQSLVYHYFTTAGFSTHGTMRVEDGRIVTRESVVGAANGVTEVEGIYSFNTDGSLVSTVNYLSGADRVGGRVVVYREAPGAKVVLP